MSEHELWNELGNLYFISGAFDQAIYAYHRSIQLDDSFGRPYGNLALAYVQQGKYEEAVELYKRSLELLADSNEKAISWNRLGNVYRHLKDYKAAVIAYQEADELHPESTDGREEPGQVLYGSTSVAAANEDALVEDAEAAIWTEARTPELAEPEEEPALPLQEQTSSAWVPADSAVDEIEAVHAEESAASTSWMEPDLGEVQDSYATLDGDAEFYIPDPNGDEISEWVPIPEAESFAEDELPGTVQAEQADEVQTSTIPAYYDESEAGDFSAPVESGPNLTADELPGQSAREIEVDVEEQPSVAYMVVEGHEQENMLQPSDFVETSTYDESLESDVQMLQQIEAEISKFKRVVQINPRSSFAWDALGTLYKSASLYKEAIFAYQQAISIDVEKASYHHHLGLAYAAAGRDEDAIATLHKVVELDPEYSLAHASLGGYYRKMGLEELAQQHIGKAMRNIYDSESEYNRACLEAICGNIDEAIELLRVALMNKQTYVEWVIHDPDLDFIRQDPRFKQLISDYTR
jgi:tetratricopeptide (TPR) repeat protein